MKLRLSIRSILQAISLMTVCLTISLANCHADETTSSGLTAESNLGMVVSVSKPASEVGRATLSAGGNAVDAAVATAFALAVTWPEAGNIGGGGFMLVHPGNGQPPIVIDYREIAPAAATVDMFARGIGSQYRLVGVPGTVRGLKLAHEQYGRLSWKNLVEPAVALARDGFQISAELASSLNQVIETSPDNNELKRVYGQDNGKRAWKVHDMLVQTDLANTLTLIASEGPDSFYTGKIADAFEAEMKLGGGIITKTDLAGYQAKIRTPIHGTYRGFDIFASPPPSSGGTAVVEMLNIVETLNLRKEGRWSAKTIHIMLESMRRAYYDRARWLGDPDFTKIPGQLTTKEYARELATTISLTSATSSAKLGAEILSPEEAPNTTHFSVIDRDGMAVSNTYTLEDSWGSRVVVRGAGFLLNNEMGDFNPQPGITNSKGMIGTKPNLVVPGKRMLSSMTPVVVSKNGRVTFVTGSPGGRTIINTVFCLLLNILEFEMPLRNAVDAPRFHHAWMPDTVTIEAGLLDKQKTQIDRLTQMGHHINPTPKRQGDAHSISVNLETGKRTGAADQRRDGWAAPQ
jgi:gamma-glutamyltranspeptidase / glutathione hydrolase